ncbi:MAG: protein-tyrosine kinase [Acidobacteriota bacterium]|jgi:capsular exopolysaccharide synthesis family protein|nr:protein-tyrosine kinase [Acidobacteriota bacterium]
MGRVYDALKRASAGGQQAGASQKKKSETQKRRNGTASGQNLKSVPPAKNGEEQQHPWDNSPLFSGNAAHDSASTAHTEEHTGSALSGVMASRAAGATLDAAGTTRARAEFVSLDISAARVEPHLIAVTQPRSAYCEQFRSLRTRVLQAGERKKMQAFVITSAGVAEGKTLTSLNLAWLLAQTDGVSALIIDSDLRQPCAAEYLGIDAPVGLSEVLSGEATLQEAIIRLEPAGLHFLPGGEPREDVAEILSGPRFGQILSEARRMFDYIIIDAPPLGIFTDANVLINRADGALLVVRSGKTRYAALDRLIEQLPRERMLGVVLNRTDEQLDESSYYYQRRYARREDKTLPPQKTRVEMKKGEEVTVTG